MSGEQFHRIDEIFKRAVLLTPPERDAYLDEACGGDTTLRDEVLSLLSVDEGLPAVTEKMAADDTEGMVTEPGSGGSPPRRIGRFTIRREIARGGMGAVYEAMQEQPRRRVAIKLIRPTLVTPATLRRFEFEAQVLGRLRHPNIAQVYEAGTHQEGDESVPYFAMEYVPGALPITDYAHRKKLTVRERLELYTKVCDAVHHGHQKGIVHRDLKPGNILVDSHGVPKVIDFGVAHATDSDLARTTLQTEIGQLIGTLPYMSPEQVDGDPEDLDTRSDVYALGVVLYELLCEKRPYELDAAKMAEAFQIIQELRPQPPSRISKVLRGDIETITLKALEKERERRYQSADEFGRDIRRYLDGEPITAHPPSVIYHLQVFTRRHRAAVAAGLVVTLAVAAAVVIGVRSSVVQARAEAEVARAETVVTSIASRTLGDFLERILAPRGLPVHVRQELIVHAEGVLANLEEDVGEEPLIRHPLATAYEAIGNVRYSTSGGSEGDAAAAMDWLERAIEYRTALVEENPDSIMLRQALADTHTRMGDCLKTLDTGTDEAIPHYEQALAICDDVAAGHPDDRLAQRRLAQATSKVARQYARRAAGLDAAAANAERSLAVRRRNARRWPDRQTERDVAVGCYLLSVIRDRQGREEEAARLLEELMEIRQEHDRRFGDTTTKRDLVTAMWLYADTVEAAEAVPILTDCRKQLEALLRDDPANGRLRRDLADVTGALARVHDQVGHDAEAETLYAEAIERAGTLHESATDDTQYRRILASVHRDFGLLRERQRREADALEHLSEARALYAPLAPDSDRDAAALAEVDAALARLRDAG